MYICDLTIYYLRDSLQYSISQQDFQQEAEDASKQEHAVGFVALGVLPDVHLGLLQLVDFLIDFVQLLVVRGTIELAVCLSGYRGKRLGVDLHRDVDVFYASAHGPRIGGRAVCADADGIDAYAEALRDVGRRVGAYLSAVVSAVRKQNDDLALRLTILESGQCIRKSHAYCSTVVNEASLCHIDLHAVQQVQENRVVNGHGALRVSLSGKKREADVIVRTTADELEGNILGCLYAVGLQVFGQHTGADVHTKHDVYAFGMLAAPTIRRLRSSQSNHGKCVAGKPQEKRQMQQTLPEALGSFEHSLCTADSNRRCRSLVPKPIPYYIRYCK